MKHTATITISSNDDSTSVEVELDWSPALDEFDPRELGYTPAAFKFMERNILPILERAFIESSHAELLEDSPSDKVH